MIKKMSKSLGVRGVVRQMAILLLCVLLSSYPSIGATESVSGSEYEVKVGFIYNFAKFITWPKSVFGKNFEAIGLCFVSSYPAGDVLFKLDQKTVQGRKIKVKRYKTAEDLKGCQIFFFGTTNEMFIRQMLNALQGRSVLTIGETDSFTKLGGMIGFFKEKNRLRFQVNLAATEKEGLKLSAQILNSAQIVKEGNE